MTWYIIIEFLIIYYDIFYIYFENNNYHDLTEKIEYLFNNKSITDKLVQKGYEVSKRYSWKNTSIKTIKTLKNILSL